MNWDEEQLVRMGYLISKGRTTMGGQVVIKSIRGPKSTIRRTLCQENHPNLSRATRNTIHNSTGYPFTGDRDNELVEVLT